MLYSGRLITEPCGCQVAALVALVRELRLELFSLKKAEQVLDGLLKQARTAHPLCAGLEWCVDQWSALAAMMRTCQTRLPSDCCSYAIECSWIQTEPHCPFPSQRGTPHQWCAQLSKRSTTLSERCVAPHVLRLPTSSRSTWLRRCSGRRS